MRKFTEMRFFHLLEEISLPITDLTLINDAYEEFVATLFSESEDAEDLTVFYNRLCYTRIELKSLNKNKLAKCKSQQVLVKEYCEKAVRVINKQLKLVEWKIRNSSKSQSRLIRRGYTGKSRIKWSGTITELVELGYATLESKSFNNGEIDIKDLIQYLCHIFDFEVKDCYRVFVDIRHRTGDRTIYLDRLKEKLIEKMERADNRDR